MKAEDKILIERNLLFKSRTFRLNIELQVTTKCGYSCPFCPIKTNKDSEIDLDVLEPFLKDAQLNGYDFIALTGGEPCMHSRFEELVELLVKYNMGFTIVSNAQFWERYKFLLNYDKFESIAFSLDGNKETHDKFRGEGAYNKVIDALAFFSEKVDTSIKTEVNNQNYKEILEIVKIAKQFKNVDNEFFHVTTFKDFMLNQAQVLEIEQVLREHKIKMLLPKPLRELPTCEGLHHKSITIDSSGGVVLCCGDLERGYKRYANIKTDSVTDILQIKKAIMLETTKRIHSFLFECHGNYSALNACSLCRFLRGVGEIIR